MVNIVNAMFATNTYLLVCFLIFSVKSAIGILFYDRPFWMNVFGLSLFLPLAVGILCKIRLARKIMATLHFLYTLFGLFALIALLYHGGTVDAAGFTLETLPAAIMSMLLHGYVFFGAIHLWRAK
ncbi:hypothetical protein [Megalodesulfovibrio paquesii]